MKCLQIIALTFICCLTNGIANGQQREGKEREERPTPTPTPRSVTAPRPHPPPAHTARSGASGPIPDGLYRVHAKGIDPARCLDIRQNDLNRLGGKVGILQIWDCTKENSWQKFSMTYDSSADAYEMRIERERGLLQETDYCLDVYGNGGADGEIIHAFQCNGQRNQRFKVVAQGDGWYQLRPMHVDNKCVDIANASVGNASEVHQWECGPPKNNQLWQFESVPPTPVGSGGGNDGGGGGGGDGKVPIEKKRICANSPILSGWILIDVHQTTDCGGLPPAGIYNQWEIQRFDNRPKNDIINACLGAVPSFWIIEKTDRDVTRCGWGLGSTGNNIMIIKKN